MKTFFVAMFGAFIGALAANALFLSASWLTLEPMIGLTVAAAEKTLGPAEAERLVREKLGREWHAGQ